MRSLEDAHRDALLAREVSSQEKISSDAQIKDAKVKLAEASSIQADVKKREDLIKSQGSELTTAKERFESDKRKYESDKKSEVNKLMSKNSDLSNTVKVLEGTIKDLSKDKEDFDNEKKELQDLLQKKEKENEKIRQEKIASLTMNEKHRSQIERL